MKIASPKDREIHKMSKYKKILKTFILNFFTINIKT